MKVRSLDQFIKLKELLEQKFITQAQFDQKTHGVDVKTLPERISTESKKQTKKNSAHGHARKHDHKRAW